MELSVGEKSVGEMFVGKLSQNSHNYRLIINLFHSLYDLKRFLLNKAATKDLNLLR